MADRKVQPQKVIKEETDDGEKTFAHRIAVNGAYTGDFVFFCGCSLLSSDFCGGGSVEPQSKAAENGGKQYRKPASAAEGR